MGRMLGVFDDDNDTARDDLNLCPDCGSYFPQDICPICGKVCPEEMRAGNRKPAKKKKTPSRRGSGRVTFVEWYHSWWFILIALVFMPIIGIVLLITSPHKRSLKIGLCALVVCYLVVTSFGFTRLFSFFESPVDTSLSREEYIAVCETVDAESFYRSAEYYKGRYVTMTVMISEKIVDHDSEKYNVYYTCRTPDGADLPLLIRDCVQDNPQNFLPGDVVTVYGEGVGNKELYIDYVPFDAPCLHVAYLAPKQ
ncbi:MAG: hypothetical protein IJV98_03660 [Clostridia bacterium]|nr:hypothetical protein [Clostridia bacterium]